MPESKHKVIPYLINYYCDECSKKPNTGCVLKLVPFPLANQYQCPNCNEYFNLDKVYPYIEYEVEDNW